MVDRRLLLACDNLTAFRTTPYAAAAAVANALNKKQEEAVTGPDSGDALRQLREGARWG